MPEQCFSDSDLVSPGGRGGRASGEGAPSGALESATSLASWSQDRAPLLGGDSRWFSVPLLPQELGQRGWVVSPSL